MAITFNGDPKIVLIDEPTQGLDCTARRETMFLLKEYNKNRIVILTSSDVTDVAEIACNTAFLKNGKISERGTFRFFQDKYSSGFHIKLILAKSYDEVHTKIEDWLC